MDEILSSVKGEPKVDDGIVTFSGNCILLMTDCTKFERDGVALMGREVSVMKELFRVCVRCDVL